ncbi:MAG: UvrD-helicase domain-containing protein [Candidatus Omnitrophica bacterium]|nr:UvrD-helicase domain-containing protein [Candidatus Omnitrophota bacterium]
MSEKDLRLLKFPQVLVVEASAGSGKTYCLAKRYIQLLIQPGLNPNNVPLNTILAITFTNKAALEMKERILEFLKRIALDKFSSQKEKDEFLSFLSQDKAEAQEKARVIMDYLVRNYNFFQVQTIDSFINAILSGCAFRLNLSANFKTEENSRDYLSFSLDKLIDKASTQKDTLKLFHSFLRQYIYIEAFTGWFPKQNILSTMNSLFFEFNKYAGDFVGNNVGVEDLISVRKDILRLMAELNNHLPKGTDARFQKSLAVFLEQNKDNFEIDNLSNFFKREGFPINKGNSVPDEVRDFWSEVKKKIKGLCELEASSAFNCYIDIFEKLEKDLIELASKDDCLFLESLNKEARFLFDKRSMGLPELYYRLATRFRHFLIDEFQDTSLLQWENLFLMIEEALSTSGSLFFVGDKKQAIYRFRGGEACLIDEVKETFKDFNLIEESLNKNYRSRKEIVDFNNAIFSLDNLKRFVSQNEELSAQGLEFGVDDLDRLTNIFESSKQESRDDLLGGYVEGQIIDVKTKEERDDLIKERVIALIEDLRKRFSLKDIAFLTRKNDEVELLTSWFMEERIPVESEKTLDIRQNSYIKEIVSFLKFLNSPIDNLSFVSFITGEIFCRASGLKLDKIQDFLFELNENRKNDAVYIYREFRLRFPKVWDDLIEEFFKSVGFVPLYELVISIFSRFNVLNDFSEYQGFFMKFLELVKEEEDKTLDIDSFLESFENTNSEDLYVNATQTNAVKIITIHKSKGLQFPVVIVPFLEMDVKVNSHIVNASDDCLQLLRIKKEYAEFSPMLMGIYRRNYLKSFIDELNSIYVAFTRPEEELYFFVSPRTGKRVNPVSLLVANNELIRSGKLEVKNRPQENHPPMKEISPSKYRDWICQLKEEFIEEKVLANRDKILRGEVLHNILCNIGNLYKQDKELAISAAFKKAVSIFPDYNYFQELLPVIKKLLSDKRFTQYFEVASGSVYLEQEIVDKYGNARRIDRLIINSEEAIVVDYKSSAEGTLDYKEQVKQYMDIVRGIYPKLKVKGILLYLDNLGIEEVN